MKSKWLYFTIVSVLLILTIGIMMFDYVSFFEHRFGLDKLTYDSTRDYRLYSKKMMPVRLVFSITFFCSLLVIIFYSIYAFKNRTSMQLHGLFPLLIVALSVLFLLIVIVGGIFQSAFVL